MKMKNRHYRQEICKYAYKDGWNDCMEAIFKDCPEVKFRRSYCTDLQGYFESDLDWFKENREAVIFLLEKKLAVQLEDRNNR